MTIDLWRMSAIELAAVIASRQGSSREVVEAHLRRIDAVNPSINAVTVVLAERAVEAAKAADRVVAAGRWCSGGDSVLPRSFVHAVEVVIDWATGPV